MYIINICIEIAGWVYVESNLGKWWSYNIVNLYMGIMVYVYGDGPISKVQNGRRSYHDDQPPKGMHMGSQRNSQVHGHVEFKHRSIPHSIYD